MQSCLADSLERVADLTFAERAFCNKLEASPRRIRRGATLQRENELASELHIVREGWLFGSMLLEDGQRQIVQFFFPGDVAGESNAAFARASETIQAVTDVETCAIDKAVLRTIQAEQPRIAALLFVLAQAHGRRLADRVATLGRLPARARVASLLTEVLMRRSLPGDRIDLSFDLPLTQEEIGDATGLTAVHVNRMMRGLVEEGLIARQGSRVTVLDLQSLKYMANHVDRFSGFDASWVPAPA